MPNVPRIIRARDADALEKSEIAVEPGLGIELEAKTAATHIEIESIDAAVAVLEKVNAP